MLHILYLYDIIDQKYSTKRPAGKESNNKFIKKPNSEKKFKRKKDTRNNNSQGTNGMHNNIPLTRGHQFQLRAGQGKPSASNPNGYLNIYHPIQ